MSSPAQTIANTINAQSSTGPRTEEGKTTSSKNATTHGLFTDHDFIRPAEQSVYAELDKALIRDLAPQGALEFEMANEIRRAMWRLRRCGLVEASMVPADSEGDYVPDPMQIESQAKLQLSVDRARSQAHRLMHKCTAELRKTPDRSPLPQRIHRSRYGSHLYGYLRLAIHPKRTHPTIYSRIPPRRSPRVAATRRHAGRIGFVL